MYRLLLLFLISVAVTSCAPAYLANVRNVPTFNEAREFVAGASYGSSALEVQTAYAVTNHLAVMANGSALRRNKGINTTSFKREQLFGELGVGYFIKTDRLAADIFGGFGRATVKTYDQFVPEFTPSSFRFKVSTIRGAYDRVFIQPSICICKQNFSISFTPRVSGVTFRHYRVEDVETGEVTSYPARGLQAFFEPAITTKFRQNQNFHWFAQFGINVAMNGPYYYEADILHFAIGLQFRTVPKHAN